jgi:hypothetical protein
VAPALVGHAGRAREHGRPLRLYFRGRDGVGTADAARTLADSPPAQPNRHGLANCAPRSTVADPPSRPP